MSSRIVRLSSLALATLAGSALAAAALAQPPARAGTGPLGGPAVKDAASASLIERGLDGTMRPPEIPLAEAALELMDLDAQTRADIEVYLAERAAVIDSIVADNLDRLDAWRSQSAGRGEAARREHMREISELFRPVLEDGPLEDRIADLLPEAKRDEYLGLIEDRYRAEMADRVARWQSEAAAEGGRRAGAGRGMGGPAGGPMGGGMHPEDRPLLFEDDEAFNGEPRDPMDRVRGDERRERALETAMQMRTLRLEIRRSAERVIGQKRGNFETFVEGLNLTSEQDARVREIFRAQADAKQAGSASPRDRMNVMRQIAEVLTPEQREVLRQRMAEDRAGEPGQRRGREGDRQGRRPRPDAD